MTSFTGKEITAITGGELLADFAGNDFCIDSRLVKKGDIFIALPGATVDSHDFINNALEAGASGVIAKFKPENVKQNSPLVLVEDVKAALLKLAKYKRDNLAAKFIAVTGSVGKTSTKEMLKLALSAHGKTFATLGNYNNDLGVPICMASIPKDTKYVVLEAGMNNPGEISHLSHLIRPDIAIITTVAPVHLWTFKDVAGIAKEKASIVDGMNQEGIAIINSKSQESIELATYLKNKGIKFLSIGLGLDAEILEQEIIKGELHLKAKIFGHFINYKLSHTAQQQITNSLFSLVVCEVLHLSLEKAAQALYHFKPTKGRGEVKRLQSGKTLIDDSYNANPASLEAAFENLAGYEGKKLAIVADMRELGAESVKLHQQLYKPELFQKLDGVVVMGEMMKHFYDLLPKKLQKGHYENVEALKKDLTQFTSEYDVILVKGSKGTGLYKIIENII